MIDVHEATTRLSELLERAGRGEEFVLARAGWPVARLVPYRPGREPRVPGRLSGRIVMTADFDETSDEILDACEGRS